MNPYRRPGLVLAVHPTSRGFGWCVFEGQLAPIDWGIATAKGNRSAVSMRRFSAILDRYHPSVLVIEQFDGKRSRRSGRLQDLARSMRGAAENRDISVSVYARSLVGEKLAGSREITRHQIAEIVSTLIPIFRMRMPQQRALWHSEDPRQSLFDAAALAITHHEITKPNP